MSFMKAIRSYLPLTQPPGRAGLASIAHYRPFVRANTVMLGRALLEQNELNRAVLLFRQVLAEARVAGDLDDIAYTLLGLAEIALCWNDLDAAWAQAEEVATSCTSIRTRPAISTPA